MEEFEIIEDGTESAGQKQASTAQTEEGVHLVNEVMDGFDINILEEAHPTSNKYLHQCSQTTTWSYKQEAEKEIEELVKDIDLENEESEVPNSFSKIGFDQFPLFLTVKEFFYLMDSLMPESFFARNVDNLIRSGISKHTGKKGYFRQKQNQAQNRLMDSLLFRDTPRTINEQANDYSSDEEDAPLDASQRNAVRQQAQAAASDGTDSIKNILKVVAESGDSGQSGELITEVEFEDFRDTFWPWYLAKLKGKSQAVKALNPTMMWNHIRNINEIYSGHDDVPEVAAHAKNVALAYKEWKQLYGDPSL